MPAPLIEFAQFAHPQKWLLRRGPPPWLEDQRWPVRAFRTTLALGLMGAAAGWATVGAGIFGEFLVENVLDRPAGWLTDETLFFFGPGFSFALLVLVPLSRWLGRGWILSVLAVPASTAAFYCGVMAFFVTSPIMNSPPDWIPGGREAAGFYASAAGAAVIAAWMGNPMRRSAWLAGAAAIVLAGIGCGLSIVALESTSGSFSGPFVDEAFRMAALYVTFQSLAAIGLGVRLWWI